MNWDRIEGNWKQVTGKAKVHWGKLTSDDFDIIAGRREQLAGKIQELRHRQGWRRKAGQRMGEEGR
jgi:uncharacterized protein YjbJ (UPF0337 family)